jgi:hypothetical protein
LPPYSFRFAFCWVMAFCMLSVILLLELLLS